MSAVKKMSVLRRHRILQDDVRRVIAHLTAHKKITANDTITRPRLKKKKDAGPNDPLVPRRALRVLAESRLKARAQQRQGAVRKGERRLEARGA